MTILYCIVGKRNCVFGKWLYLITPPLIFIGFALIHFWMKKNYDLSLLEIEKAIVHDIPKHKIHDYTRTPVYSERESEISERLKLFFVENIVKALSKFNSFKICFKPKSESPIKDLVTGILSTSENDFVKNSQDIGQHLFNIQTGSNAAGILFIIKGSIQGNSVCIIMKLERDSGAQMKLNEKTKTFDINV